MTFSPTFGRLFSPTFQPNSLKKADTSWWLSGGIAAANCVAAYQPKGAASYAASKVNLANPGTYDAVDGTAYPTWTSGDGWYSNNGLKYLDTGIKPNNTSWSYIVSLYYTSTTGTRYAFGSFDSATAGVSISFSDPSRRYCNGKRTGFTGITAQTVYAIAGLDCYLNGTKESSAIESGGTIPNKTLYLLNINYSDLQYGMIGYIRAIALYNTVLTSTQIGLLTTAMAAL